MKKVIVVAADEARRAALRDQLLEAGIRVERTVADTSAMEAPAAADAIVVTEDSSWRDVARVLPSNTALVAVTDDDEAAAVLADRWGAAWGVVTSRAIAAQLASAVAAVDAGLVVQPASGLRSRTSAVQASGVSWAAWRDESRATELDEPDPLGSAEPLTPREQDVLALLVQGLSNRRIADALGISDHTVKFHVASIYAKLGARSRADAVRRAYRRGLVTL